MSKPISGDHSEGAGGIPPNMVDLIMKTATPPPDLTPATKHDVKIMMSRAIRHAIKRLVALGMIKPVPLPDDRPRVLQSSSHPSDS